MWPRPEDVAGLFSVPVGVATGRVQEGGMLHPEEADAVARAAPGRRLEFAAGRRCARAALAALGAPTPALPVAPGGGPVWPNGFAGSLSHTRELCVAAAARLADAQGLGVDVEPIGGLSREAAAIVCSPAELAAHLGLPKLGECDWALVAFCAKEAAYKCCRRLAPEAPSFHEVNISFQPDVIAEAGRFYATATGLGAFPQALGRVAGRWRIAAGFVLAGATLPPEP